MANAARKAGTLIPKPNGSYSQARDAALLYALAYLERPTLQQLAEATGYDRGVCIKLIKLFQASFPTGYSMVIENKGTSAPVAERGYVVKDWGVVDESSVKKVAARNKAEHYHSEQ